MRVGVIVTKDAKGGQYVLSGKQAIKLETVEISNLKDQLDVATLKGLKVEIGKSKVEMVGGILLTNDGLVKRKNFYTAPPVEA